MAPLHCVKTAFTARTFLRLANRTYATVPTCSAAPLEFLIPRWTPEHATRHLHKPLGSPTKRVALRTTSHATSRQLSRRAFGTTTARRATVCVRNPQKDEDGNDMMLEITPRAAKRLSDIMAKDANPDLALRVQVESGGCHGFQYLMSLITLPKADTEASETSVIGEDDSIFQYKADGEAESDAKLAHSPRIILDEPSLDLLKGSKVDFTVELIGSQFKITDNPAASSSCGCGTSFDIKM
ncbi:iron-sulfur cluster biosynthesis domain-containing protein [Sarocladium implicatum]|nr:iron-sulfur cluster biosynthesis domain-containing protein [Sarocladium implicatum]